MPRPNLKRAIPQKSFLPPRGPGRIGDDSTMTVALPGIAESLRDEQQIRRAATARRGASPQARPAKQSRPSAKTVLSRWFHAVSAWLKRRAERRALRQATERLGRAQDHLLKDIGITQTEIAHRVRIARRDG